MKKILTIGLTLCCLLLIENLAHAYIINGKSNIPVYSGTTDNAYGNDLIHIEDYLFGKNYRNENINERLNRIEKKIFKKSYSTMNTADRMNNILANYKKIASSSNTYGRYSENSYPTGTSSYFTRNGNFTSYTPRQRLYNRFIGQPTGFTPSIINSPFHPNSFRHGVRPGIRPGFRAGYRHRPYYNRFGYRPRRNSTYGTRTYYGTPSYLQPTSSRASITILD